MRLLTPMLTLVLAALAGCGGRSGDAPGRPGTGAPGVDDRWREDLLRFALDNLERLDEFAPGAMLPQVVDRLNQWAPSQEPPADWQPDPLLAELPPALAPLAERAKLDALRYSLADAEALAEAFWVRDVATWARGAQHDELARARRLFDWTVRNVQLEPQVLLGGKRLGHLPQLPWETLLTGRGAPIDRAWLFLLLAQQQGLDAVLLGLVDPVAADKTPRPWAVGLRVDREVYVFEPALGLPIPAPGAIGLGPDKQLDIRPATLAQLAADPALLARLAADTDHPYVVKPEQLSQVVALVAASPASVSRRMKLIQTRLVGTQKALVSAAPSAQAQRWRDLPRVSAVRLWLFPWEVTERLQHLAPWQEQLKALGKRPFEALVPQRVGRVEQNADGTGAAAAAGSRDRFVLVNALWKGRLLHLRGQFAGDPGAIYFYQVTRPSDAELRAGRKEMIEYFFGGLVKAHPQAPIEELKTAAQQRADQQMLLLVSAKHAASYWLGAVLFETGEYRVAADYFNKRTLEALPNSPWSPGANYQLARTDELLGRYPQAIERYRRCGKDFGDAGAALRAAWLEAATAANAKKNK